MKMKETDRRLTPGWVLDVIRGGFGEIGLDPCTEPSNPTGAKAFFCPPQDGLLEDWPSAGGVAFVNPPFSQLRAWTDAVIARAGQGHEIIMLTPADSTTAYFAALTRAADIAAPMRKRCAFSSPDAVQEAASKFATQLWYMGNRESLFVRTIKRHAHPYKPGRWAV